MSDEKLPGQDDSVEEQPQTEPPPPTSQQPETDLGTQAEDDPDSLTRPTAPASATPAAPLVPSGSQVVLVVSRGPVDSPHGPTAVVPELVGTPQSRALTMLQEVELAAHVFNDYSASVAQGRVITQHPQPGRRAFVGAATVLIVSNGAPPTETVAVPLPDVVGLAETEATKAIQAAGLSPKTAQDFDSDIPEGSIAAQLPSAESLARVPPKRIAAWIWVVILVALLSLCGGLWFAANQSEPAAVVESTSTVEATQAAGAAGVAAVPNVTGMSEADAESALVAAGFVALVTRVTTNDSPAGTVIAQIPEAGQQLSSGSQVAIQVAQASEPPKPASVTVPSVVGMTQANAQSALSEAGLAPAFVTQADSAPKGQAFGQDPPAGNSVPHGTVVIVGISSGTPPPPSTVPVPNVVGLTQSDAQITLTDAQLDSQVVQAYDPTALKGTVFKQWPPAGNQVGPGTPVALVVSMGAPPAGGSTSTVPNVKGMTADAATQALSDAGLVAQIVTIADPQGPVGTVIGQLPAATSVVPEGSTVLVGVAGPGPA